MSSLSMPQPIASTTLLTKQELPGAFRLEFHNKNDRVIAELYKSNILQAACSLEEVSVRRWEYELSTESIQRRIKGFLIAHRVPIATENMIERETQTSHPTPGTFFATSSLLSHLSSSGCPSNPLSFSSSLSPSILQDIPCESEREAADSLEESELSVGSFSCVSPMLSSHLFSYESAFTQEIDSHKRKRTTKHTLQEKAKALRSSPSQSSSSNKSSPSRNVLNFPSPDSLIGTSSPHQLVPLEILEHQLIKLDYPQQKLEILLQTACREQNKRIVVDALFHHLLALERMPALDPLLLDVKNSQGYTLLLAAVALGDQAKFEATLPLYKDQDALYIADLYGRNALHLAAAFCHATLIPRLIDEGFELNVKDHNGLMPLHWAIHGGHVEAVQTLVTSGASLVDPWVTPDGHYHSPLELAIVTGDPAVLNLLLTSDRLGQLDLTQPVQGRGTLFHLAIYADQAPMLKHLLSNHAEKIKPLFNYRDPQGRTPLQLAAYLGDVYALYLLFRHGADLHYGTGENEGTAVHYAALGEQPAAIELLYNLGAELERTNGKGQTPLVLLEGRTSVAARRCRALLARLPRMARVALTEPPKYAKRPPFNLVLQGGGPREMAYLGALEQMEKLGTLKELKRVAGTSAGAITAAFLAVGCTTAELSVYLDQNLGRFLDAKGELEGDLLAAAQNQSYQEAVRALLKEYWGSWSMLLHPFKRAEQLKEKLQQLTGLASGDAIRNWMETIIQEKTGKEYCTFKELKALVDSDPEKYKELHIFSLCLKQGKQPQLLRFSHEDPKWDDLILSDAIRASLSIPGVFQPHILHFKDATGTRHARDHHGQFIDGSLLRNDPLTAFDAEKYQEDRYFRGEKTNRRTLGLSLRDETVHTEEEVGTIASSPDLVKALVSTFYHAEQILMEETGRYKDRTIEIPIHGVGLLDFNLTAEVKGRLIASGREAIDQFFSSSILSRPSPKPSEPAWTSLNQGIPWRYSLFYDFQPRIQLSPEEKLRAVLSSLYSAKDTLSIFRIKSEQEWEFKLPLEEIYVRLGIIEQEARKAQDKQFDTHSKYLEDGRIPTRETIFEEKKAIEIETLFEHESLKEKEKKRVYVQGAAGSGKSTLCHYIVYRWAKGGLWNTSFKYLFCIPLRNLTEKRYPDDKTYTPIDLIVKEYEGEVDLREFQTCLEQPDVRNQTLILLDGYDELSSDAQRETGSLAKAFNKLKELFPHLLITSRPGPCSFDRPCDLELLGFDRQGIADYIDKFFTQVQGEEKKKKLQHVLTHSPHALSLAHTPINLTLLCSLFNEDPKVFDSGDSITMTFIYDRIVNQMYKWFMLRKINQKPLEQTKETILASTHLRGNKEVKRMAQVLEEMAFFMMEKNTLYLNKEEIEEFAGKFTLNELTHCGLLRLPDEKGYFIHSTFREFLTASKLANHYLEEKEREKYRDFIRKNKFEPRYNLIFRMMAGYLSIHTATNRRRSHVLQEFFNDLFAEPHDLAISYELNLLAECFEECQDPTQIKQHSAFIEIVTEYMKKLAQLGLDFRLLDRREKLLNHPKVIDTIKHLLEHSKTTGSILNTLSRNGVIGQKLAPEIVLSIVNFFNTSQVNYDAVYVLGKVAQYRGLLPKEALDALVYLLNEGNAMAKRYAILVLGQVAKHGISLPKEALDALKQLLHQDDAITKSHAVDVLAQVAQQGDHFAKEAFDILIQLFYQGDAIVKRYVAQIAEHGGHFAKEALDILLQLFHQGDDNTKRYAVDAVGKVAQHRGSLAKEALYALIQLLSEGDTIAKRYAISVLGQVAKHGIRLPKEALDALKQFLHQDDAIAKGHAVDVLAQVAQQGDSFPEEALDAIIHLVVESEDHAISYAADTLGEVAQQGDSFPEEVLGSLVHFLRQSDDNAHINHHGDDDGKGDAVDTIGKVAQQGGPLAKKALDSLVEFLHQSDDNAHINAVYALGQVVQQGGLLAKEALEVLIYFIDVSDDDIRSYAAVYALGKVVQQEGHFAAEALETLIQTFKKDNSSAKSYAADTLGEVVKHGGRLAAEALEALIQILKEDNSSAKSYAADALGEVAKHGNLLPKRALEALIQVLDHGDDNAKSYAADALRAINKDTLLKMDDEAIPLIAEICFFSDNSFSIQDKKFRISDQRTIYPSMLEAKLCYEEIRKSLPVRLAKWREQLDSCNLS